MSIPLIPPSSLPRDAARDLAASGSPVATGARTHAWATLLLVAVAMVMAPAIVRVVSRVMPGSRVAPSYLPALEVERDRVVPFDHKPIDDLRRIQPRWVFIGDSMLGTRIDAVDLAVTTGNRGLAMIVHAGTGSAFWYLALKNWVIASNVKPKYVFVFFRDENMTDPMFRVTDRFRWSLDRVARSHEPVLNDILARHTTGPWFRAHRMLETTFGVAAVSRTADAALRALPSRWFARDPSERVAFEGRVNELFGLDRMRPMAAADMEKGDRSKLTFGREVTRSVLPEMATLARRHQFTLVLVRVQRRPPPDGPPRDPPALREYVADLRRWAADQGVLFLDDTGAPDLTLAMYEDGDHLKQAARPFYTDWFRRRHASLFE